MKSIIEKFVIEPNPLYPCLMQSKSNKIIVLMDKPDCGTVIYNPNNTPLEPVGSYHKSFLMSNFEIFNGAVYLSN